MFKRRPAFSETAWRREELQRSLREAQLWCGITSMAAGSWDGLWDAEVRPSALPASTSDAVLSAVMARSSALFVRGGTSLKEMALPPAEGRILLFDPSQSLSSDVERVVSGGYLDRDGCPPWGTWIAWHPSPSTARRGPVPPGVLSAWVPAIAIEPVKEAMANSMEASLSWLGDGVVGSWVHLPGA